MTTTHIRTFQQTSTIGPEPPAGTSPWRQLYAIAAGAGMLMFAAIPAAVAVYLTWPPPYDEPAIE